MQLQTFVVPRDSYYDRYFTETLIDLHNNNNICSRICVLIISGPNKNAWFFYLHNTYTIFIMGLITNSMLFNHYNHCGYSEFCARQKYNSDKQKNNIYRHT